MVFYDTIWGMTALFFLNEFRLRLTGFYCVKFFGKIECKNGDLTFGNFIII